MKLFEFVLSVLSVVAVVFGQALERVCAEVPAVEWEKTFRGTENDWAYSVQQTTDGGYIVAGQTLSLIKLDPKGDLDPAWPVNPRNFGGSSRDGAKSVQQTTDGGYIVAGYTDSFGAGEADVYLIKLDSKGNLDPTWPVNPRTFGGADDDLAFSIQQTLDSGYIVAGETGSFGTAGRHDIYLIKLGREAFQRGDANGDETVDLSDAVATFGALFNGDEVLGCADAADANDDGKVDISDPIAELGYLFLGSARLPEPSGDCGADPTEDSLGCGKAACHIPEG